MQPETAAAIRSGSLTGPIVGATPERIPVRKGRASVKVADLKLCPPAMIMKPAASAQLAAAMALRDQLVLKHLPLVKAIAIRLHHSLPGHVVLDDLIQSGNMGLLRAASSYSSERHVVFSGYAKHRIRGAILDSLRQLDWASRDIRRRHKQVETATRSLTAVLQRAPFEAEVAEKLGMDVSHLRAVMLDLRSTGLVSASTRSVESQDVPAPDFRG